MYEVILFMPAAEYVLKSTGGIKKTLLNGQFTFSTNKSHYMSRY
jgi:hypothetical protein